MVAVIIAIMGLLITMFGPGNTNLRYSKKEAIVASTCEGNGERKIKCPLKDTARSLKYTKKANTEILNWLSLGSLRYKYRN